MIAVTTPSAPTVNPITSAATSGLVRAGYLDVPLAKDEPLYLGREVSTQSFPSVDAAIREASQLSTVGNGPGSIAVVDHGGSFSINEVRQPVWRSTFGGEEVTSLRPASLSPVDSPELGKVDPKFGFEKVTTDFNEWREGKLRLDAQAGVVALVGGTWAFANGAISPLTPTFPQPAPAPAPSPAPAPAPAPAPSPAPAPPNGGGTGLIEDVTEAARLATESLRIINTVPQDDTGSDATKDTRIKAYKTNLAAQKRIEEQFAAGVTGDVLSTLRSADASLEDANWQLAKKPSPDGRFNGVDIPGAVRDTQNAVDLLSQLRQQLTASGVSQ